MSIKEQNQDRPQNRRGPMGHGGPPMGRPPEKARDFKGTLKRLAQYLAVERYRFILVFFLAIGSTLFSIVGPKIMGMATTKLGEGVLARYDYMMQLQAAVQKNLPIAYIKQLEKQAPTFDLEYVGRILLLLMGLYIISALVQ
jgi:ATP-binding cassette subfamily B multidrug efflux pump